ncbi:uncharacterized protein LOC115222007 isoform X2 [Octopus sinensis]|uniref:Uncharacterized protein LOC115222007 isoform X2 n=1 Tax=Octopus sinensis TaxID=2607531 RepID=A0A7E6FHS3_9MOLL|nr:uncharacterized protein LOC115222007 isoform X2 [Octopus sinensis]
MANVNNCCQNCGKTDSELQKCKRCKVVFYCSDICEMEDRDEHSRVCSVKNMGFAVDAERVKQNIKLQKEKQIAIREKDNDGDGDGNNKNDYDDDDDEFYYFVDDDDDDDDDGATGFINLEDVFNPIGLLGLINPFSFMTNPFLFFDHPLICPRCKDFKFQHIFCPICRQVSYCSRWCLLVHLPIHRFLCQGLKRRCARCERSDVALTKCSSCNKVEYCSTLCRIIDWEHHKTSCVLPESRDDESFGTGSDKDQCARCKKSGVVLKKCTGCNNVQYCSKICQTTDWKQHKPSCKTSETKVDKSSNGKSVKSQCARCKKSDAVLKKCSGCNIVEYCSRACQSVDWTDHKTSCKRSVKSQCARCKKSGAGLKKCSGCNSVEYCSRICQTTDWEQHKTSCKRSVKGQCARCKKSGVALKKCVACNNVEYCSKVCQTADWEHHKTSCKPAKTEDDESSSKISVKGRCGKCKRSNVKLIKCPACDNREYCSQVCQIADWTDHRKSCQISESKGECANCSRSMRKCSGCNSVEIVLKNVKVLIGTSQDSCKPSKVEADDSSPSEKSVKSQCARCKKSDVALKKCAACNKIEYCSKICQTADWKHHKNSCRTAKPKDDKSAVKKSVKAEKCDNCGKFDEHLKECAKCKIAKYCSKSCQISAWPLHKKSCKSSNNSKDAMRDHLIKTIRYAQWLFPSFKIISIFVDFIKEVEANQKGNVLLVAFIVKQEIVFYKPNYIITDIDGYAKILLFNFNDQDPSPYFSWEQLKPEMCICILNPKICPEYKVISIDSAEQIRIM